MRNKTAEYEAWVGQEVRGQRVLRFWRHKNGTPYFEVRCGCGWVDKAVAVSNMLSRGRKSCKECAVTKSKSIVDGLARSGVRATPYYQLDSRRRKNSL